MSISDMFTGFVLGASAVFLWVIDDLPSLRDCAALNKVKECTFVAVPREPTVKE